MCRAMKSGGIWHQALSSQEFETRKIIQDARCTASSISFANRSPTWICVVSRHTSSPAAEKHFSSSVARAVSTGVLE